MQIDRLIGILSILLQQEKVTAPMLAKKFEVSRRTINRDIDVLCKAGIPIITAQGASGGISILDGYKIDKTLLKTNELQAIISGLQSLDSAAGSNKYQILMDKLSIRNSDILASNNHILINLSAWNKKSPASQIEMLQSAIENHRLTKIKYYSKNRESERIIEPYLLIFQWLSWYVWSYCTLSQEFRMFKLNRMDKLQVLEEVFKPRKVPEPNNMQPNINSEDCFHVLAAFDESIRWKVMEEFRSENMILQEDGRIHIEFSWPDKKELFLYILEFGNHVEIIEPQNLRQEFEEFVQNILKLYN